MTTTTDIYLVIIYIDLMKQYRWIGKSIILGSNCTKGGRPLTNLTQLPFVTCPSPGPRFLSVSVILSVLQRQVRGLVSVVVVARIINHYFLTFIFNI